MRCPVAYHTSCLPKNCTRSFPGKRIICPKHEHDAAPVVASVVASADDASPAKSKKGAKEQQKPLKTTDHEPVERVESAPGESPSAVEEVKVKTESRSDSKAETREASSSSSKKLSKSAKREKKKKKKKRKKASKRDSKEGRSDNNDDGEDDGDEGSDATSKKARIKTEGSDGDAEDEEEKGALAEGLSLERVDSFTLPALSLTHTEAVSPATSSSLYESPAAANERIKARLVEALGQSDDDVESLGSPISLPTPKVAKITSDDAAFSGAEGLANAVEQAKPAPAIVEEPEKMKQERISEGEDGDDEAPGGSSSPTLRRRASSGTPRGGDATDGTKGKASSSSRSSKKKKKKTKSSSSDLVDIVQDAAGAVHSGLDDQDDATLVEEKDANEAKWVQCDSCKKWRTVPKDIDLNTMPERWYCEMNTWDATFASCSVDEEGVDPAVKKPKSSSHGKRSKGKSKSKMHPDPAAPLTIFASDGGASSPSSGPGTKTPVTEITEDAASGDKSNLSKKQDKQSKKRKLKLKLKEKYREVKWVQCESSQCGKWRVVPSSIDFSLLPAVWYCHLNTWAPEIAKCSAPNPPEVETFLMKSHSKKGVSSSSGSRPSKKAKSGGEATVSTPDGGASAVLSGGMPLAGVSGDVPAKPPKSTKTPKGGIHPPVSSTTLSSVITSAADSTLGGVGGGNSTPGGHNGGSTSGGMADPLSSSSSALTGGKSRKAVKPDGIKKTVLEWAQCEKCNKWRKLPQHIKSSTLPDKWYCSMNHWDPVRASCSVPEEADQEPLSASPLPSSQNYYPMPGHFGNNSNGVRSKRSKLSYSELLYAGTGQLRKTYTSESSTLSFEYDGRIYHRDDQYKDSSMYVSPQDSLAIAKNQTSSASGNGASASEAADVATSENPLFACIVTAPNEPSVEQVATLVLDSMDLRHTSTIAEMFRAANSMEAKLRRDVSLSLVTAAVGHLVEKGLIEKQESEGETDTESERVSSAATRVGSKRRRPSDALSSSAKAAVLQFRKVPKRPLKASKCWKLGQASFEFPLKD